MEHINKGRIMEKPNMKVKGIGTCKFEKQYLCGELAKGEMRLLR
jgi:hypothetical protein